MFQVIGASPEECNGYTVPINDSHHLGGNSGNKKSWWIKRHERMEEVMKEQVLEAQQRVEDQQTFEQQKSLLFQGLGAYNKVIRF